MENSTPNKTFLTALLYIAAVFVPLVIRMLAVSLGLDIVLAFAEPLLAIVFLIVSTAVLVMSAFRAFSARVAHIATASLVFWIWLTYLVLTMHVEY